MSRRSAAISPYVTFGIIAIGIVALLLVGRNKGQEEKPVEDLFVKPSDPPGPAPEGMVWIPGGKFWMGSNDGPDDESPMHEVGITGFWMDRHEVTNAEFAKFVDATEYVTVSERVPDPKKYVGALAGRLVPGSALFKACEADLRGDPLWWPYAPGADWKHPEGPGSSIKGKENYPVVHITWEDASAYAVWAEKRLPTEAEWEFAARGGLDRKRYCWGDQKLDANGKHLANTYQGNFPAHDSGDDGFAGLAPVESYSPNGYGLYDMAGNAWEWCSDWYDPEYYGMSPRNDPPGPDDGVELVEGHGPERIRRGGSFLCADNYCRRYLPASRDKNPPDSSANHTGFRCVKDGR